jgi:hypothetical protein
MNITVTRLGGRTSYQINGGPMVVFPRPEREALILSIDGEEVDRKQIGANERYGIMLSGDNYSLVIRQEEQDGNN